jgi:heme exporter protein B
MFFSFLIVVIFAFSFDLSPKLLNKVTPGIIWSVIILGSTGILSDSFKEESESFIFYRFLLSPISMTTLVITRTLSNMLIIIIWEFFIIFLTFIFLNFNIYFNIPLFILTIFLGSLGYIILTTFFSLIVSGGKSILMAIIIYPLILPLLMGTLKMTSLIFTDTIDTEFYFWLKIVIGFNLIYLSIIVILTEIVFESD